MRGDKTATSLMGLSRSAYYYMPVPEDPFDLLLMRVIDAQFTRTPYYGVRKITAWLKREDYEVNQKRVRRLMRLMGLEAIYPKPNMSKAFKGHKKYPYLLRDLIIDHPNQVWSTDITYL